MITQENSKVVFIGESEANNIYPAFSPKAQKRWRGTIGRLLHNLVEAEIIHNSKQSTNIRSYEFPLH